MSEEIEQIEHEVREPSDAEAKAVEQGWAPKDQWHGDPDKWVDAESFLERGEKNNAILRERNDKLSKEIGDLRRELRDGVKQFGEATRKAEERAYSRAMKELQAQQLAAVENGDTASWQRLEKEREGLVKEFDDTRKPDAKPDPDQDPTFLSWHEENRWYNSDVEATAHAEMIAPVIARRHGNQPTRAFYDDIAKEIKRKFPQLFRNVNRDAPGAVQGASESGGKAKKGKGYSDLPPEAKAACDKFVKQKLLSKEQYVKDYFGE